MKIPHLYIYTLLILNILTPYCMAQPKCRVTTYNTEKGLPSSIISSITQTTDNLLWLSTPNGLTCYDGYRFTTFGNTPGLPRILSTNHLMNVCAGADDNLWIVNYYDEVMKFDTHSCSYISVTEIIKKRFGKDFKVRKIYTLRNGATWLVGRGDTHYRIVGNPEDDDAIKKYVLKGNLNKVMIDASNREWCFTSSSTFVLGGKVLEMCFEHLADLNGKTWLVSKDGKIAVAEQRSRVPRYVSTALAREGVTINDMEVLDRYRLALGTSRGVTVYDTRSGKMVGGDIAGGCERLYVDSKKRLWCFNGVAGVTMCQIGTENIRMRRLMTDETLNSRGQRYTIGEGALFHEDEHHTVWVIPTNGVFAYYDEQGGELVEHALETVNMRYGVLPSIRRSFTDRQGNLWLQGTHNLFLADFLYQKNTLLGINDNREVRSILVMRDGSTVLGNTDGYITRHSVDGKQTEYLSPTGQWMKQKVCFSTRIYTLYEDKDGRLWIGTKSRGLYVVSPDKGVRNYVHDDADRYSLSNNDIYDIQPDTRGRMMIATYDGGLNIAKWREDGTLDFIHHGNELKGYNNGVYGKARRILTLKNGVVLLSTSHGLLSFSDRYKSYRQIRFFHSEHNDSPSSLYSSEVLQTCQTSDGQIYVTTIGGGLQRVVSRNLLQDNIELEDLRADDGKPIDILNGEKMIKTMVADNRGYLWILGESRLAVYGKNNLTIYSARELGNVNTTEAKPVYDARNGRLLFGAEGGAVALYPKQMRRKDSTPPMVFTAIRYLDLDVETPILNNDKLDLDVDHRSFVLYYAAIDYHENTGIRYAYKIDDGQWQYVRRGSNATTFNNFPAGHHTIYVKSTNTHGVWMNNVRELHIYAQPTFMESWYGRTILALAVLTILVLLFSRYLSHKKREIKEEAIEIADASKVRFVLRQPEIVDEQKVLMEKLMAFIEEHISDPDLKVDEMAAAVNLGRSVFYSRMKQMVDMAPNDFLRHVRMQRAEDLIRHSTQNFSQIAYAVGFTDPKYFGKCFKKHTGMSPSEYRSSHNA